MRTETWKARLATASLCAALLIAFALLPYPSLAQVCVSSTEPEGAGGTGRANGGSGLGGSGAPARGDEGGIGGTGLWSGGDDEGVGGTGIVGTITGFGSLCVNGLRVSYDDVTAVTMEEKPYPASRLGRGDVVRVAAERRGDGLYARSIELRNEALGRIAGVAEDGRRIEVLGQRVRIGDATEVVDARGGVGAARPVLANGDFVRVAGLRRADGEVVASRVERVDAENEVGVAGRVEAHAGGGFAIGGLEVASAPGAVPLVVGRDAILCGQLEGARLVAHHVQVDPAIPFAGALPRLSLEGFPQPIPGSERLALAGLTIDLSQLPVAAREAARLWRGEVRARVGGRLERDGVLVAERLEIGELRRGERLWRTIERDGEWHERRDTARGSRD